MVSFASDAKFSLDVFKHFLVDLHFFSQINLKRFFQTKNVVMPVWKAGSEVEKSLEKKLRDREIGTDNKPVDSFKEHKALFGGAL